MFNIEKEGFYFMPNFLKHNQDCNDLGIDRNVCKITNKWMDAPSQQIPGCEHRNFRHSLKDCSDWASQGETLLESKNRLKACRRHIELDSTTGNC